jgi:chaperone modulatory protein CbpM
MEEINIVSLDYGGYPVRSRLVAWAQFQELTAVHPSRIGELIDLGWIEPIRTQGEGYLFTLRDVYRLRKLERLCRDLDINAAGGCVIVDLLERIEYLEQKVGELERLL